MDGHGYQMANARPYKGHTQVQKKINVLGGGLYLQSCETEIINYILL